MDNYMESSSIRVFPSTYRSEDSSGKFTSEYNFVNIINSVVDYEGSYVISSDSNTCSFVIHGYYFYTENIPTDPNLWASILVENSGGALVNYYDKSTNLDSNGKFNGVYFSPDDPKKSYGNIEDYTLYSLEIRHEGTIVNRIKLSGKSISGPYSGDYSSYINLEDDLSQKQYKVYAGEGLTNSAGEIGFITNNRSTQFDLSTHKFTNSSQDGNIIKLNPRYNTILSKLSSNVGSGKIPIWFDGSSTDPGFKPSTDSVGEYGKQSTDSSVSYIRSNSVYLLSGEITPGVSIYGSTSSPSNNVGKAGDIWLTYVG